MGSRKLPSLPLLLSISLERNHQSEKEFLRIFQMFNETHRSKDNFSRLLHSHFSRSREVLLRIAAIKLIAAY